MMEYEQLRAALDDKLAANPALRAILKRIGGGTATFNDTAEYARVLSHILGRELESSILELSDRESIAAQLLRDCYDDINRVCTDTQMSIDEAQGLHIKPQKATFPRERVQQFAHSLTDPTVKDSVIKRRAGAGSETITKSFHDNFIEKNAKFRNDAGLKCHIIRIGTKCCDWCTEVAGKYEMGNQPEGIFRRHDNCDCIIIYDGQVLRGKLNVNGRRSRTWEEVPDVNVEYSPPVLADGKNIEQRNLQRLGLLNEQNYVITPKKVQNAYSVNRELVNSKEYHDKFENLTAHKSANESVYQQSKRLLEHRDGKFEESLIILDSRTGNLIVDNFDNTGSKFKTGLTNAQYSLVKNNSGKVIMIHNHPESPRPSGTDILTLLKEQKAEYSVIVGHDGTVYEAVQ